MTSETPSPVTAPLSATEPEGRARSLGWQLLQIGCLVGLLLVGMHEVDLDARALAERRARSAFLLAVERADDDDPGAPAAPGLQLAIESYARTCAQCGAREACDEMIRAIRTERKVPVEGGPCKEGILERWRGRAR